MKILLQNCETLEFYKSSQCWTSNPGEAMEFTSSSEALDFCFLHRQEMGEIQILMKFSDSKYDMVFPVTDGCREALDNALKDIEKRVDK